MAKSSKVRIKSKKIILSSDSHPAIMLVSTYRGYWGVENKVHYVRDVTQGEDASRIRTKPLPQIFAIARNFTLNLYRSQMFENMAQARALMFILVRHT
ncbi:MAG: transposase [Nostoc sp.]